MQQQGNSEIPITMIQEAPPLPGNGKFHVRLVEGFYQNLRRFTSWPMLALFFGLVWVRINGDPLVLFDFESHRIFLFGAEFSWYDLPVLAGLLIAGASLLFFMAVGWGRIWCGFACPQSIWTWIFIRIEDWTEGRAALRSKSEEKSLTGVRLVRRVLKHGLWLLVSVATAITFSGYFVPIEQLLQSIFSLEASLFVFTWIISMALLTYFNAGLVREKVCLHMCPYSRFQGVMFDEDTRTVAYNPLRGEPRTHLRGKEENPGDCIDCGICVQVCPTGIDIRDGLQAACIDCGACIDACDNVMTKLGRPTGLIEFYSEKQLQAIETNTPKEAPPKQPILRPRLIAYMTILIITVWGVVYGMHNRTELLIEVARERGQLYQVVGNEVCNSYQIELESFLPDLKQLSVSVQGVDSDQQFKLKGHAKIELNKQNAIKIYQVCAVPDNLDKSTQIQFNFRNETFYTYKASTFLTP
ncbi:cytochrome c oxidase accessory protein CcoG [Neptuniibacter sp. QD72_48]|uniref:cytochrome c oxidase accessory protein CcoG n=1 Tax=unclassified Neptuniibacter TaxID=2630693 RepID=UPI0039F5EE4B